MLSDVGGESWRCRGRVMLTLSGGADGLWLLVVMDKICSASLMWSLTVAVNYRNADNACVRAFCGVDKIIYLAPVVCSSFVV